MPYCEGTRTKEALGLVAVEVAGDCGAYEDIIQVLAKIRREER